MEQLKLSKSWRSDDPSRTVNASPINYESVLVNVKDQILDERTADTKVVIGNDAKLIAAT